MKLWKVFFLFIFLLTSCEDVFELHPLGGEECVLMSDGSIRTGDDAYLVTCNVGYLVYEKQKDGSYLKSCVDSHLIQEEVCGDGLDNECDGLVDNIDWYPSYWQNDCSETQLGVCKLSHKVCIDGEMICVPPDWAYGPEVCDRQELDEDCDGLSNENDPSLILEGEEWVYLGPDGTLNVGECRAGHRECRNGEEVLYGMVLPIEEICGNR